MPRYEIRNADSSTNLKNLRLVDTFWCSSASKALFRIASATLFKNENQNESNECDPIATQRLQNLASLADSKYAEHVRHIMVGVNADIPYPVIEGQRLPYKEYVWQLVRLLPGIAKKVDKLTALTFVSTGPLPKVEMEDGNDAALMIRSTLANVLHELLGANMQHLYLHMPLPGDLLGMQSLYDTSPQHLSTLQQKPIQKIIPQLYSVHVSVDMAVPRTLTSEWSHLVNAISSAKYLHQLYLSNWYNSAVLDMNPNLFVHLRTIMLYSFTAPFELVASLIQQNLLHLRQVRFFEIELTSGSWQPLLKSLEGASNLVYLFLEDCKYSGSGATEHLYVFDEKTVLALHSTSAEDYIALASVIKTVHRRREQEGLEMQGYEDELAGLDNDPLRGTLVWRVEEVDD